MSIKMTNFAVMKFNDIFSRFCNAFPVGAISAVIFSVILLLTLMPSDGIPSVGIPHIDKVVHFLMFGAFSSVMLFDYSRFRGRLNKWQVITAALISTAAGGAIELLQMSMGMGRGAEWGDFIADALGAFFMPVCFLPLMRRLVLEYSLGFSDVRKGAGLPRKIIDLYIDSFPPDERRPVDSIKHLIDLRDRFHFTLIRSRNRVVGFITWWSLDGGVYVEHFATFPAMRSCGLGKLTMERFCELHKKSGVILEVELPASNTMADRRIGFYERCGFKTRPEVTYVQPPYAPGLHPVELLLMTFGPIKDASKLAGEIKRRVYGA